MKNINTLLTLCLLICSLIAVGQSTETITIPLSNPSEEGFLNLSTHNGRINIVGYEGNEIEMNVTTYDKKNDNKSNRNSGLRRIPNQNLDVNVTEENNNVRISGSNNDRSDYDLKVPKNFSLQLSSHHNGEITVSNIMGEIEVNSHHGGIQLENISGSVIADTHHGEIVVSFNEVTDGAAMAFSTYHGDVDITFPDNVKADLKMKSSKGSVYTDFDFEPTKAKLQSSKKGTRNEIKLGGWTLGKLGSGGEEFMFKTYHGDILIRKK